MLSRLFLKDFAIAAEIEVELRPGMGVISGETGAGKSLLVDALLLLTGARADAGVVRHGASKAELIAEFELDGAASAAHWLREAELESDGECLLRRVIRADGGSRAWINSRPATLGQLAELSALLVGIHGQHEHQALLDRRQQLALLDAFAAEPSALTALSAAHRRWRDCRRSLSELEAEHGDAEQIELLRHHLAELERRQLSAEYLSTLQTDHRRQAAAQDILASLQQGLQALADETGRGARRQLQSASAALQRAVQHAPELADTIELLSSAAIQVDEAIANAERIQDDLDLDPARLDRLDEELSELHDLARKHRCTMEELEAVRDQLNKRVSRLDNLEEERRRAEAELSQAEQAWQGAAAVVSAIRAQAGQRLSDAVSALMSELGMAGGRFEVALERHSGEPNELGAERVEFMVSANPGQPARPLRRVASGGELARISLAIEVASLGADALPTLIFDEVDSGIGGAVAEVVGQKLRQLGEKRQVLCVTHLAQVAAQAHQHFRVSKVTQEGQTSSAIQRLGKTERVEELSRMMGGVEITAATRTLARQLLDRAANSEPVVP
ncbi:DNA repair protein RecN [Pseudomarimonas arenosa]|uniref:DNA repair protein RecN n=1 Tax=Pseudomarimonas arenosa TaxID=2774145 RepID=A0AAW3ZGX3_9GAMM|nr:DNA repair protein RecN [Pseudomarimonas arenosa]